MELFNNKSSYLLSAYSIHLILNCHDISKRGNSIPILQDEKAEDQKSSMVHSRSLTMPVWAGIQTHGLWAQNLCS